MLPDYYRILRIKPDALQQDVRAAYRRMAKRHHPDAGGSAEESQLLQEACQILGDPTRRREYDAQLETSHRQTNFAEPLIPEEPLRLFRGATRNASQSLEEFDRFFREFDEFFKRLEEQFLPAFWGRNE